MNFPEITLRKDPQILVALQHAKGRLAATNNDAERYMLICTALGDSPAAYEIRTAINAALAPHTTLWQWYSPRALELTDVEIQARRHAWLDQMILDQIRLPTVKLRRRPEIKAILVEAKTHLLQRIGDLGQVYLCHAVSKAAFDLGLFAFFKEVQAAILEPLGSEENTAYEFFRQQHEGLNNDQCQVLRHRWLDQMIGEQ